MQCSSKVQSYPATPKSAVLLIFVLWTENAVTSNVTVNNNSDPSEQLDALLVENVQMKRIQLLEPLLGKGDFAVLWLNSPQEQSSAMLKKRLWNEGSFRVCTDGAANFIMPLVKNGSYQKPDLISGDFDSITNEAKKFFESQQVEIAETPDQDYTDMCKALGIIANRMKEKMLKVSKVIILGGLFGRFDHVLSSLQSLLRFQMSCDCCDAVLIDGVNLVTLLHEGSTDLKFSGDRHFITGKCGVIPFVQRETTVTSSGLKWNLNETELAFGKLISTSNEVASDTVSITSTAPTVFTVELSEHALS